MTAQLKLVQNPQERVMPSDNGFAPLWRDIKSQPWYSKHKGRYTAVFVHLLMEASHNDRINTYRGQTAPLKPGQLAKTYEQLARELGQTKSDIQNAFIMFRKLGQISTKSDGKYTVITLENWGKFNTVFNTASNTPQPHIKQGVEVQLNTVNNTANNTQNNNYLEQEKKVSKDTCEEPIGSAPKKRIETPYQKIVELYAEILPDRQQVRKYETRKPNIRARHKDLGYSLSNWRKYFEYVRDNCQWMTSGNYPAAEKFDYLFNAKNFEDIYNGGKDDRQ